MGGGSLKLTKFEWFDVKKDGIPDKTKEASELVYITTIALANGGREATRSEWGPVNKERLKEFENDEYYRPYIYDGWAFGDMWEGEIDTVDCVVAWDYMPKPYLE